MSFDKESKTVPFAEKKLTQSSNVDDAVLNNLSSLISSFNEEADSKNFQPLIQFFQKGYVSQVIQLWSYYAQVNNHPKFSKSTTLLVNTLRLLDSDHNIHEYGSVLINLILTGHVRVLYRGLNNIRASLTNPILRLMKEIVCFNSGQHVEEFTANFDFSLPSLVKILSVNKADIPVINEEVSKNPRLSIRIEFLNFWLTLIAFCAPLPRKQLMTDNSKIMSAWFKLMDKLDPPDLMIRALDLFKDKILGESSYKRMTKCKILNELALSRIYSFYHSGDKALVKKVNEFFLDYGCNKKTNIAFPDDAVWFSESPFSGTHKGAEIVINQRPFKVYNKLLFNVLKFFKPWEDDMQANTVVKILDHVPELVAPYCTFLTSHGSHDPKMTSYWFGSTMIFGRIIRLEIPQFMKQADTDVTPSIPLVMESILPSPLTKLALTKALQHDRLVIRQLVCHLIVFAFQKLESVLELFETKGWTSAKNTLRNAFYLGVPDLSVILSVMNQSYNTNKSNKILQLSVSTILKYYSAIFPNFFSIKLPSSNIFVDIMQSDNFSGIELALLNNFLQFQELSGLQTKWWSNSSQERSIFTSLLNVARTAPLALTEKICQLLDDMFRGNVAFNRLLCSPQRALVHSLQLISSEAEGKDLTKIWSFLDETIQRCMKTPYKYVDMAASHSRVSPFIMALFEQWKFVKEDTEFGLPARWFSLYLRTMIICGEPESGIKLGVKTYLPEVCENYIESYLTPSAKSAHSPEESTFRSNIRQSSFLELIILSPYSDLKRIIRHPISRLDAVGLVFRINSLVKDSSIKCDTMFKSVVEELISKLTNYAETDRSFDSINARVFESIIQYVVKAKDLDEIAAKSLFVAHLMAKINQKIRPQDEHFGSSVFVWLQNNKYLLQVSDEEDLIYISSLLSCLTAAQSIQMLEEDKGMNFHLIKQLLKVLLKSDDASIPFSVIELLLKEASEESLQLASYCITEKKIHDLRAEDLLQLVLKNDLYSKVMESYVNSAYFSVTHLLPILPQISGPKLSLIVAVAVNGNEDKQAQDFVRKVINESYSSLNKYEFETSQIALTLYQFSPELLSDQDKISLIDYLINDYSGKYTAAAVALLVGIGNFEDPDVLKWLNKLMLYINRNFSSSLPFNPELVSALEVLGQLPENVWQKVNQKLLHSQLEVILSGEQVTNIKVLQYVLHVCLSGCIGEIQHGKLIQCLFSNEKNALQKKDAESYIKFLTTSVVYVLYLGDPAHCSNDAVQEHLLRNYEATVSGKDRLILKMLELIESNTSQSWTDGIYTWEFLDSVEDDYESVEVISKQKEGLVVTLKRQTVINTAINYSLDRPEIPLITPSDVKGSWKAITSFYERVEGGISVSSSETYDPLFLLLSSIQNEELVKRSKSEDGAIQYAFNVKAFLSSNIFQVIICSLGGEAELQAVALVLIKGMLSSLQEKSHLKDLRVIEFLLSRIVYTFYQIESAQVDKVHHIAPCIWFAISQLSTELTQTGSQLHEKAFRWVLSNPLIRPNDMPLLQELLYPKANLAEQGLFYRQLGWVLNCLEHALKIEQDVEQMKRMGVLEWLSNLTNLPYINGKMRSSITAIFFKCQRIDNSGSSLITRVASISTSELQALSLDYKTTKAEQEILRNQMNMRHLQKSLILQQQELNVNEVLAGHLVLLASNKRLRDWTEDDSGNIRKRMTK